MVQLILGKKGKGKTVYLLEKVNSEVKKVSGNIVYLDKNTKQMYELNNRIRLIDVSEHMILDSNGFLGFICGIISQDHDLERMYLDSFLTIASVEEGQAEDVIHKLEKISNKFHVDFVLSATLDVSEMSEEMKEKVIVSL